MSNLAVAYTCNKGAKTIWEDVRIATAAARSTKAAQIESLCNPQHATEGQLGIAVGCQEQQAYPVTGCSMASHLHSKEDSECELYHGTTTNNCSEKGTCWA